MSCSSLPNSLAFINSPDLCVLIQSAKLSQSTCRNVLYRAIGYECLTIGPRVLELFDGRSVSVGLGIDDEVKQENITMTARLCVVTVRCYAPQGGTELQVKVGRSHLLAGLVLASLPSKLLQSL